jgi:hypothetical protein
MSARAAKNHPRYVHFSSVTFFPEATRAEEILDAEQVLNVPSYVFNGSRMEIIDKLVAWLDEKRLIPGKIDKSSKLSKSNKSHTDVNSVYTKE